MGRENRVEKKSQDPNTEKKTPSIVCQAIGDALCAETTNPKQAKIQREFPVFRREDPKQQ